jgi:uncharacterized protein YjbJ (UPF0337 family)
MKFKNAQHMNTPVNENWTERKIRLKKKFEFLTQGDLLLIEGDAERVLGKLQNRLGKSKEELQQIIKTLK